MTDYDPWLPTEMATPWRDIRKAIAIAHPDWDALEAAWQADCVETVQKAELRPGRVLWHWPTWEWAANYFLTRHFNLFWWGRHGEFKPTSELAARVFGERWP